MRLVVKTPARLASMACLVAAGAAQADEATDWAALARADIEAAHRLMLENHPGPVDAENPGFMDVADASLEAALELADKVETEAGFVYALRSYGAAFRDGHFVVYVVPSKESPSYWPGFVIAWRADRFTVSGAAPEEAELVGAELVSCDGTDPETMTRENVFRFDSGKLDQPAYWAYLAPDVLFDRGNPFVERAKRCTFRAADGRQVSLRLNWRETDESVYALRRAARFGSRPEGGVREFASGRYWINLPDFNPNSEEAVAAVQATMAAVEENRDALRNAAAIVVDVRGNNGGNSAWGDQFVDALWGEKYRLWRRPADPARVDWRASPGNLAHVESLEEILAEQGHAEVFEEHLRPVAEGMRRAIAEGRPFFKAPGGLGEKPRPAGPVANPVKGAVFFLTHGFCGSSCLDFADLMLSLEGVTHIGFPTFSDTNYIEVRPAALPSGKARLIIPLKVYRGRLRADSEYYDPAIRYDGLDWSDEAIEGWASEVIDARLN